jgi:hypothetical protein
MKRNCTFFSVEFVFTKDILIKFVYKLTHFRVDISLELENEFLIY